MEVEVRVAGAGDLVVLDAASPAGDAHRGQLDRQAGGASSYLVAWAGTRPVGTAVVSWAGGVREATRRAFPDPVEVVAVHVDPAFRNRGMGTALVADAERLAAARGVRTVVVTVDGANPRAAALWTRLGYRPTGVRDRVEHDWTDPDGVTHHAVEHVTVLAKTV